MKFEEVRSIVEGVPYTNPERGRELYNHIIKNKPERSLELGFAHGVASCYIAAALHEIGSGHLTCVDLDSSADRSPNLEELLDRMGVRSSVDIRIEREKNSYTWFLKKEIERNTTDKSCNQIYDFCFIDGPKNWTIDGLAFFCVDKLLKEKGWILFDDFNWVYSTYSKDVMDGIVIRDISEDQAKLPNIKMVFELLIMQHPSYSEFIIDGDWAWARKVASDTKSVHFQETMSVKYRVMKKIQSGLAKIRG